MVDSPVVTNAITRNSENKLDRCRWHLQRSGHRAGDRGALAAAGAVAGAGAFQHSRTTVSDRVTEDIDHTDRLAPHKRTGGELDPMSRHRAQQQHRTPRPARTRRSRVYLALGVAYSPSQP